MISKEGLTVLIQLVNLAQKRGAYNLEESYLAFMVLKDVIDDPKYKRAVEAVKELFPENVTNKDENNNVQVNASEDVANLNSDNINLVIDK
jgi:hypothetical protein